MRKITLLLIALLCIGSLNAQALDCDSAKILVEPPLITTLCEDSTMMLVANATGNNLSYAWYFGGMSTPLAGFTTDTLKRTAIDAHEGEYQYIVFNSCSSDTSRLVDIKVIRKMVVAKRSDREVTHCEDDSFKANEFKFEVINATKYKWTWYADGVNGVQLPDTTMQLKRSNLLPSDAGMYVVEASNGCATPMYDTMYLIVNRKPRVTVHPEFLGQVQERGTIRLTAASEHALSRHWLHDNRVVQNVGPNATDFVIGAATDTLIINWANALKHNGKYRYVVTNLCGTDTSDVPEVVVTDTSKINMQVEKKMRGLLGAEITSLPTDTIVEFTLRVTNNSSRRVYDIMVVDTLPVGFEFVENGNNLLGKLQQDSSVLRFTIADSLGAYFETSRNIAEFAYKAKAVKPGTYSSFVYAECLDKGVGTPTTYGASSVKSVHVFSEKDLMITKQIIRVESNPLALDGLGGYIRTMSDGIIVGDLVTYRVTVKNVGRSLVSNISVSDCWSVAGMMYYDHRAGGMNTNVGNDKLTIVGESLNSGQEFEFEVTLQAVEEGYQTLSAEVTTSEYEVDTTNNRVEMNFYLVGLNIQPVTITPNGDGINDDFVIRIGLSYPNNELLVYSCKGDLVYGQKNYYNQFNGDVPSGTYVYVFRFADVNGKIHKLSGSIIVKSHMQLDEIPSSNYHAMQYDTTHVCDTMHIYDTTYLYDTTCPDDSSINTALTVVEQGVVKLYPNPSTNGLLMVSSKQWNAKDIIEVYSLVGALVATYSTVGTQTSINVSHLPSGTYIVRVGRYSGKFIKQ